MPPPLRFLLLRPARFYFQAHAVHVFPERGLANQKALAAENGLYFPLPDLPADGLWMTAQNFCDFGNCIEFGLYGHLSMVSTGIPVILEIRSAVLPPNLLLPFKKCDRYDSEIFNFLASCLLERSCCFMYFSRITAEGFLFFKCFFKSIMYLIYIFKYNMSSYNIN